MIDLREIRETIEDIKRTGTTVGQAEKLALLYIVEDRLSREESGRTAGETAQNYALAAEDEQQEETDSRIRTRGTSEFLAECDGARIEDVLEIMDEHMEAIKVLYPKEHKAIIERLERLE